MGIPPQHMPLVQIPLKEADTLQSIFDENPGTDYELVFLYICNWGKHRSFAVAWVHEFIFRKLRARSVARAESLSARHFGKWSCGANACEECDFRLDEKEAVHDFFYGIRRGMRAATGKLGFVQHGSACAATRNSLAK